MRKPNAKMMGYKVIDEFEDDIASIVHLEFDGDRIVGVIDEFGDNIITMVKIVKK